MKRGGPETLVVNDEMGDFSNTLQKAIERLGGETQAEEIANTLLGWAEDKRIQDGRLKLRIAKSPDVRIGLEIDPRGKTLIVRIDQRREKFVTDIVHGALRKVKKVEKPLGENRIFFYSKSGSEVWVSPAGVSFWL